MTVTGLTFMFVFLSGLVLGLVRHPMFALCSYVGVFYLHPPSRWWGLFLPDLRWSLTAAVVTLFVAMRYQPASDRPPWYTTTPAKLLIAYTIWLWLQNYWAIDKVKHLDCTILFTKFIAVYFMVYRLVDTPEKIRAFLFTHLAGCLYLGFLAWTSHTGDRLDGVGGPGIDDSSTLGMHIATGALAAAMLMLMEKKFWWGFCALAAAFSLNTLVLSGSRGAFLGLIAGALLAVFLRPRAMNKKFVIYAVIACFGFGAVASTQFWARMDTLKATVGEEQEIDGSAESRIVMAEAQLEMAKQYPFGNGHRGSEALSANYLASNYLTEGGARSSHNTFLTALVEQGIPGALLFLGYCIWGARAVLRLRARTRANEFDATALYGTIAACGLLNVLVAGMFADFLKSEVQIWLAALLVVCLQSAAERNPVSDRSRAQANAALKTSLSH